MNYYKLIYDDDEDDSSFAILRIDENTLNFDRHAVDDLEPLGVDVIYATLEGDVDSYDYIPNDLAWLIVSERIKRIFEDSKIGKCEFVQVKDKNSKVLIGYLIHIMSFLNAFDEENAVCTRKTHLINNVVYEYLMVIKYAVYSEKVEDFDIFKLQESNIPYFVSELIKEKITQIGAKGFDFIKIKST